MRVSDSVLVFEAKTRLVMGAGEASSNPAGARVIRQWIPAGDRGQLNAIFNSGSYAGPALCALVAGPVMAILGWRALFFLAAGIGLMWLVIWLVWFERPEDARWLGDPELDVGAGDVLVLQNAGPHAAGMPEAGYLPIPKKLAQAGVKDMVRISDARMSGTAFGTIVLHVAPEAAAGGPLAAVRNGDRIRLSIKEKRIDLLVDQAEIARRLAGFTPPPVPARGYKALFRRSVTQAPDGCDFDFLAEAPRRD